ncbi:uncharacterized protein LOC115927422 [Strongylocentrotus purpuratus]|uniref:Uncharacterized protein n=1 Tax=Strongylocentrotus purpuratus TaxID=7668 RepID=A0A7M7PEI4_STRPU|nr:uncharacterized protein LOC115927422 [Strongylocentrotus purpuratus]
MLPAAHLPTIVRVQLQDFVACTLLQLIAELSLLGRSLSKNSRNVQIYGKKRKIPSKVRLHTTQIAMTGTVYKRLLLLKSKKTSTENSSVIMIKTKGVGGDIVPFQVTMLNAIAISATLQRSTVLSGGMKES